MSLAPEQTLATAQQAAAPTTAPPAKGDRDPWFDNAKMLLVTLVVVGHSWTLLPQGTAVQLGYDWLYLWHMPAFVMVTGYLSRRFTYSWRNMRRLVTTVVVPYLLFEGLFAAFRVYVGGETLERLWLNPHWPLWYLVALFFWRLATPFFRRTALPLTLAVGVSLVGGIAGIETLDLSRTTGILPFFVAGLLARTTTSPGCAAAPPAGSPSGCWPSARCSPPGWSGASRPSGPTTGRPTPSSTRTG